MARVRGLWQRAGLKPAPTISWSMRISSSAFAAMGKGCAAC